MLFTNKNNAILTSAYTRYFIHSYLNKNIVNEIDYIYIYIYTT